MRFKSWILRMITILALTAAAACASAEPTPTPAPTAEPTKPPSGTGMTAGPGRDQETPEANEPTETDTPTVSGGIDWEPQIVYSSPAPGQEVLLDGAITIRFDQPMNQESVQEAFAIEPAVRGDFMWTQADTLIFTPETAYKRAQTYEVQIADTAKGANGKRLREPLNLQVETVGFLEVGQILPQDGAQNVENDGSITVVFNRPVVPLVATQDQADLVNPLTITPEIEGEGEWVSTSIYRLTPTAGFAGGTNYSVTVNQGLTDITGGVLAQAVTSNFSTQPPLLINSNPFQGATMINPTLPISLTFSVPMDHASTEAAVTLSPSAPVTYQWNEDSTTLGVYPQERLELETNYELSVASSAQAATGQSSLDQLYNIPFTTVPFPAVLNTIPMDGETNFPPDRGGIEIEFTAPMDWDTVDDQLIIEPEPDNVVYNSFEGGTWININFPMEYETEYSVTIPATAADPYGNTIGEAVTFSFTTGNAYPFAYLNLPFGVNYFSASFPTTVDLIHRNMPEVKLAVYDAGLPIQDLLNQYISEIPTSAELLADRRINLENAPLNRTNVYDWPVLRDNDGYLDPGIYYVDFRTLEPDTGELTPYPQQYIIVVAETNLVVKEMVDAVYVWATAMASGQPLSGRPITLYDDQGAELGTVLTDGSGIARFDYEPQNNYLNGLLAVTGTPGTDGFGVASSRWSQTVSPWEFNIAADTSAEQPTTAYVFSDRPLYRPGDTVYFRGSVRDTDYGRYRLPETVEDITLMVQSQNYFAANDEPFSFETTLELDERGNFSGDFELPAEADLGDYSLSVNDRSGNWLGFVNIQVAEFRTPEFGVTMTPSEPELLRGQPANVTLQADYFFGGSAAGLEVYYTVYDASYSLPTDLPYNFSDSDFYYFWIEDFYGEPSFYGNYLFDGQGTTDAFGRLNMALPANMLADVPEGSRQVTVEATVIDVNNQPIASRTTVIYHAADGYVGVSPETYIGRAGEDNQVNVITVDWDAKPVPNRPVEVILYRQEWVQNDETKNWELEENEVGREQLTTDENGEGSATFAPDAGGTYRARAIYTDAAGREHKSSVFLWLSGSDAFWRPQPASKAMQLIPDKNSYTAGETARVLVQSPFTEPVQAWLTIERGKLIEQRLITLQTNSDTLNIPLPASYAPNVFVSITAVKGEENGDSPYSDIRLGVIELPVAPDPLLLKMTITPNATRYQPQDTAVFDIVITDNNGAPVATDLALSLVDQALLTLAPDNAVPIGEAFYHNQPYRSQTGASLVLSAEGLEVEVQDADQNGLATATTEEAMAEEEAAFDGAVADEAGNRAAQAPAPDLQATPAPEGGAELEVRSDFRETAYWEALITTDANGRATVEIPLPDNLTTWQLNVKAITAETLVGQESSEITVAKPLLLRPITPRFFTVGDIAQIGTVINNNSNTPQEVTVQLGQAQGVKLLSSNIQTVTVPANNSEVVRWEVIVDEPSTRYVDLIFTAESADYDDATRPTFGEGANNSIPVYKLNAEDIVATSGVLNDENRRVEAVLLPEGVDTENGSLELHLNASLAAAVLDSLEALDFVEYDYACAHSIASQLLPNAVTALSIRELELDEPELRRKLDTLIPEGIERIVALQKEDGGWGWCTAIDSEPWFTAYVLLALDKSQEAGYNIPAEVIQSASSYLQGQLEAVNRLTQNRYSANRQAFFHYVLAELGADDREQLDALYEDNSILLDPYGKALLMLAYGLSGGSPNQDTLMSDIFGDAVISATGAHWENDDYGNLSSDIRSTAIVLYALAEFGPEESMGPQIVNWLMRARDAQLWRSPHESAWVLLALNSWMVAQDELNADYDYLLTVNGTAAADGSFDRRNIAETAELSLPISQLDPAEVNFLDFQKNGTGNLYYNAYLDTFVPADLVSAISRGITVQRTYYDAECDPTDPQIVCEPITEIAAGQQVRVELTIIAENDLVYAVIEDYFPAGAEAIDPGLQTSPQGAGGTIEPEGYRYGYWGWWYFNNIQYRNERIVFTSQFLPRGTYQYTYTLQAVIPGEYQVRPTFAKEEFLPEVNGRGDGAVFVITE